MYKKQIIFTNPDYKFIKTLSKPASNKQSSVGLYQDVKNSNIVVIRVINTNSKIGTHKRVLAETNMMKKLEKFKITIGVYKIRLPKVIKVITFKNQIAVVREYVDARPLSFYSNNRKIKVLNLCLNYFSKYSDIINNKQTLKIPTLDMLYIFLTFPLFIFKVLLKNITLLQTLIRLSVSFYIQIFNGFNKKSKKVISHRELHQENILIKNNNIYIIDAETCAVAQWETDIAVIARFYFDDIGVKSTISFLKTHLKSNGEVSNFTKLTIFYTVIFMAFCDKNSQYYRQSERYLYCLVKNILPFLTVNPVRANFKYSRFLSFNQLKSIFPKIGLQGI